jgi:hypothetical protein
MSAAVQIPTPLKRRAGQRGIRTPGRRKALLKALRKGHGFHSAAIACGISYRAFAQWRAEDAQFAAECDDARDFCADTVEHELYRQAMVDHNTVAAIFYLKGHRPEVFNRKMMIALGGDPDAPAIAVSTSPMIYPRSDMERPDPAAGPVIEATASEIDADDNGETA